MDRFDLLRENAVGMLWVLAQGWEKKEGTGGWSAEHAAKSSKIFLSPKQCYKEHWQGRMIENLLSSQKQKGSCASKVLVPRSKEFLVTGFASNERKGSE